MINIPLEKMEALIQAKIDLFYLTAETAPSPLGVHPSNSDFTKRRSNQFGSSIGFVSRALVLAIICFLPLASFSLGFKKFEQELRFNSTFQTTQLLLKQAKAGNADAQNKIGWRYHNGVGLRKSKKQAVLWYRRAAKQGFAKAQYNLGLAYQFKRGVKRDYRKAAKWFRRASNRNLYIAKESLALLYDKGRGVDRSYKEALKLFGEAAGNGNGRAEYYLGIMHEKGHGVAPSNDEATNYYTEALARGYTPAKRALLRVEKQATPSY